MKIQALILGRLLFATASTVAVIAFLIVSWYDDSRGKAIATVGSLAAAVAESTNQKVIGARNLLGTIARRPGVIALDPQSCEGFKFALESDPSFATILVVDRDGQTICAVAENGNVGSPNFADRDWFREAIETNRFVAMGPYTGRLTGLDIAVMAHPIRDADGAAVGLMVISQPVARLHPFFNIESMPPHVVLTIVNRKGAVVHRYSGDGHGREDVLGPSIIGHTLLAPSGTGIDVDRSGTELVFGFREIAASDWVLVVSEPVDQVLAHTRRQSIRAGAIALAAIGFVFLFAFMTSRHLTSQIGRIATAARGVADGDSNVRMPVPAGTDFETIARQFNRMLDTHEESERRIRKLNGLYAALSETSQIITKVGDRQRMIESVCRVLCERCDFAVVWVGFIDPDTKTLVPSAHYGNASDYIDGFFTSVDRVNPRGNGPIGRAIQENSPQVLSDLARDKRATNWYKDAAVFDLRSAAVFPIVEDGIPCGVITLYARETNYFGDRELMSVIGETASALSFALDALRHDESRRESEDRFRQIAENIGEVFWLIDADSRNILYVSAAYEQIWGRSIEDVYRSPEIWLEAIHQDDRPRVLDAARSKEAMGTYDEQYRVVRPDGSTRWIHDRAFPIRNAAGEVYRIAGLAADITTAKQMEDALRRSEATLLSAQELAGVGSWERDMDTGEAQWSATMFRLMNRDPALGIPDMDQFLMLIDPADRAKVVDCQQRALRTGEQTVVEFRTDRSFGPVRQLRTTAERVTTEDGRPRTLRGSLLDITNIKDAEARLFQAQKMEALGNLAGGIAHDFNNMLLPILNLTELSSDELPHDHPVQENLALVIVAATRASNLVKQILAFGRRSERSPRILDIAACLKDAVRLLRNALPSTITLIDRIDTKVGQVEADPAELHSVILNMGTNSAHAMTGTGRLILTVSNARLSSEQLVNRPHFNADQHFAKIDIVDTGHGMDTETMAKIFNPFFTTKPVGEGTGLGLAMVHGIVESIGGFIDVSSEVNVGTTFSIYLPLVESQDAEA